MLDLIWLIPALPLLGFVLILLFGRILGEPKAGILATLMVGGSFVVVGVAADMRADIMRLPSRQASRDESATQFPQRRQLRAQM